VQVEIKAAVADTSPFYATIQGERLCAVSAATPTTSDLHAIAAALGQVGSDNVSVRYGAILGANHGTQDIIDVQVSILSGGSQVFNGTLSALKAS
jgi:hypothetical protein